MSGLKRKDLLDIQSLTTEEITLICDSARYFKDLFTRSVKTVPVLRGKTVCCLFYEPSTRTKLSFELAAKRLSADLINLTDYIVMRHAVSLAPHFLSKNTQSSVINGGDGFHAHPTQALLDAYSILEKRGTLEGLHIGIVGDIKHSRVARSDIEVFKRLGAEVSLCGPPTLVPDEFSMYDVNIINMLRIQQERQQGSHFPSIREYHRLFALTVERLKKCRDDIIVMHPGPINRGVEIDDAVANSPNAIINEQVTNGVAIRMSIFYLLSGAAPLEGIDDK
jgi:aspartate carbamoyltransferase catalytic subunit